MSYKIAERLRNLENGCCITEDAADRIDQLEEAIWNMVVIMESDGELLCPGCMGADEIAWGVIKKVGDE